MSTVEPKQPERSLGELIGDLGRDLSTLVRQEIELGREEISAEVSKAGKAGAAFGAAGVVAFFAALALVLAAGWALAAVMPTGLAFLIVGLVLGADSGSLGPPRPRADERDRAQAGPDHRDVEGGCTVVERTTELRQEIEGTRDQLGDTLEAIGDRVSPGRVVERRWNRVRSSVTNARHSVMGRSSDATGAMRGQARGATEAISGTISGTAGNVTDAVRSAPQTLQAGTEGNPLLAGAIAFGLGMLIGSIAPASEAEKSIAGDVAEPLKQELTEIGQQVGDAAQSTAKEAVAATKDAATEAADHVKSQAQQATEQVKGDAQQAKETVASSTHDAAQHAAQTVRDQRSDGS